MVGPGLPSAAPTTTTTGGAVIGDVEGVAVDLRWRRRVCVVGLSIVMVIPIWILEKETSANECILSNNESRRYVWMYVLFVKKDQ